jgi:glycosyltransferase involved in cell wall biosynthesis
VVLGLRGFPDVQGGVEKHCEHLTVELARLGCDVTVLTRRPYVRPGIERYHGVRLLALPAVRQRSLEAPLHTLLGVFAARRLRPDVLHLQAIGPALWAPLARLLGLRVVVTHHGPDYEREKWGGLAKAVLRLGERLGVSFAHRVIAIAPNIAARLEERFHRRAAVIPNGVVLPTPRHTTAVLKKFGLAPRRYFLAVGRYVPEKNFCDLIEAFGRLRLAGWKLVIAGREDHASAYGQRIRSLAAATPGVVLTGFVSGRPLEELYSHAGLFVLPSSYEGLPLVLLEALSYGLPCVVSDIPANRAVDAGLEPGRFFRAGDIAGLARVLSAWATKPFSAAQRRRVRGILGSRYNWKRIAAQTLEVYRTPDIDLKGRDAGAR